MWMLAVVVVFHFDVSAVMVEVLVAVWICWCCCCRVEWSQWCRNLLISRSLTANTQVAYVLYVPFERYGLYSIHSNECTRDSGFPSNSKEIILEFQQRSNRGSINCICSEPDATTDIGVLTIRMPTYGRICSYCFITIGVKSRNAVFKFTYLCVCVMLVVLRASLSTGSSWYSIAWSQTSGWFLKSFVCVFFKIQSAVMKLAT